MSDLLAALALVLVLEGLALVMLARSLPELLATLETLNSGSMRWIGLVMLALGSAIYLVVRG